MILRYRVNDVRGDNGETRPAWQVFLDTQRARSTSRKPAEAVVLQIAHSALAGQLATHLLEGAFGPLPPEVAEAAAKHDLGWTESDERQAKQKPARELQPFPEMKEDELSSWRRSLAIATEWPPLTQVLISRHFSALANQPTPQHQEFLRTETARRQALERGLGYSAEDLKRWAGAVGMCDLLSLYLCSGTQEPAEFPLAHPTERDAAEPRSFTVTWGEGRPVFSPPVFRAGAELHIGALRIGDTGKLEPASLRWTLESGSEVQTTPDLPRSQT